MNTTHILFACVAFGLFLFAGCASINSSNYEDRMTAVRAIESEDELMTAFHETNYEDVRQIIIERLKSEDKLVEIAFNSNESPTLRKSAALKFQSDTNLFNVVTEPSFSQPLRSWAANHAEDQGLKAISS